MKFVDYKCNDCEKVSEYYVKNDNSDEIKCESCGGKNMIRVFTPIKSGSPSSQKEYQSSGASSGKSCSGSCSGCSGCS
ncbi:MAG: FmdB family zinc ribbon protein [Candidatus Humimicrobiaceae bacterium]